jgi:hypothetical protein
VNQGHLPIAEHDLCGLLDHLARNGERVWVGTVVEVGEYIARRQEAGSRMDDDGRPTSDDGIAKDDRRRMTKDGRGNLQI